MYKLTHKSKKIAVLWMTGALLLSMMNGSPLYAAPTGESEDVKKEGTKYGGTISGVVKDEAGLGLPGVLLKLNKGNRYTMSGLDGTFVFLNVPAGEYIVSVQYVGFQEYSHPVTVSNGVSSNLTVALQEAVYSTGEVVVLGTLAKGQAKALTMEKNNSNISNIVASDQIGRFPDANIGESLKRIAGITMQNDQGEARNIIVRGLAPSMNSVTLNGGRIPSAEGDNRNVQMDLIPSDMIQVIEVNKTLLPDMEADAIGGSVNLVTKSAPRRQIMSIQAGGGYNMIRDRGTYNLGLMYGNRFFGDRLGAVFSMSYMTKDYGSDNIEGEWTRSNEGIPYMEAFQIRKYDVKRTRRSVALNLDYEFSSTSKVYMNTMFNWRDDWENRFATAFKKIKSSGDKYVGDVERSVKMGINDDRHDAHRLEIQQMINFALGGEHVLGSKMEMEWGASFARALEQRPEERSIVYRQKNVSISERLQDPLYPEVRATNEDYDKSTLKELVEKNGNTWEDEWGAKLNFRVPMSLFPDQKGRLRFGTKLRIKHKTVDNNYFEATPIGDFPSLASVSPVVWDNPRFMNSKGYVPGLFPDPKYIGSLDYGDASRFDLESILEKFWTANYTAKENVYAGYLRWDQNFSGKLILITGLRVELTSIDYVGHTLNGDRKGDDIKAGNRYTNIFPNLTFRYQPTDKWVFRTAFSTSIARPNYYALVPYVGIDTDGKVISQGNPKLKSTYAYNFDLIGTYYPGNVGLFSFGLFYKYLDNFIYNYVDGDYTREKFASGITGITNPIPQGESDWTYRSFRNGTAVNLYGLEVSYQRQLDFLPTQFLKRFSIYLNGTFTRSVANGIHNEDGQERVGKSFPGTSPFMLNASLSYEDKLFTARLSLNHSDPYLDALGSDDFTDVYYGAQTFLDFNAGVNVAKGVQIYIEANNLLDTPLHYFQGSRSQLYQLEYYKPTINMGLKWIL